MAFFEATVKLFTVNDITNQPVPSEAEYAEDRGGES
jgi:hypothetical protein